MEIPKEVQAFFKQAPIINNNLVLPNRILQLENFEDLQIGYRVHGVTGKDLTGDKEGNFQPTWYVIAQNYFADPFFVDFTEATKGFPVYIGLPDKDKRKVVAVASTLSEFTSILKELNTLYLLEDTHKKLNTIKHYLQEKVNVDNAFWAEVMEAVEEENEAE